MQLVILRWCPNFFPLAGRQVFQAQIRHRAGAHYHANADEKRAAREERVCSRLNLRRPPIRQLNRPTSGGAHALDDGDQAWHEPTDAFTHHIRNQVYVWIPGQRRYEQNGTSAPDQCHGERERTENDTVWLAEHNASHVVQPGHQEHGRHAGNKHGDRQRPVVPVSVLPAPGTVQQRAHVSGLYGYRQVRRQVPAFGRALHEQRKLRV